MFQSRIGFAIVVVIGALAASAGPAWATTTASIAGTTLLITNDGADGNGTVVVSGSDFEISDALPVVAGTGCSLSGAQHALCPIAGLTTIAVNLGDGADTFSLQTSSVSLPAAIDGGAGNDLLYGGAGSDVVHGGTGDDTVDAGFPTSAPDQLFGDDGNDKLQGWLGADALDGGAGNDDLRGHDGGDTLTGGEGNDKLYGQGDSDPSLDGGPGDDRLDPGNCGPEHPSTVNVLDGGAGSNTADLAALDCYPYPYGGSVVSLDGLPNDLEADDETHSKYRMNVKNVTTLVLSGRGRDVVTGSPGNDVISGGGERVDVTGGVGDDIDGGGGDDQISDYGVSEIIDGGAGADTIDFSPAGACSLSLDGVANDGAGASSNLLGFENAVGCGGGGTVTGNDEPNLLRAAGNATTLNGLGGDDQLVGGDAADTLNGGDGNDLLKGGAGSDTLNGDAGSDTLIGELGGDTLIGGPDADVADYSAKLYPVTVTLDGAANDGLAGEGDNVQTDDVTGGLDADAITGDAAANGLSGGGGNDTLSGGAGDDRLEGGTGADVLAGQGGDDTADYSGAGAPVTVTLDGIANDGYAGEGDDAQTDSVLGGDFADLLTGDDGANVLNGGDGADQLSGLGGADFLIGGTGQDQIATGAGADTVLARDGEIDALSCDAKTGKTITADQVDTSSTCDLSGAGVPPAGPTGDPSAAGAFAPYVTASASVDRASRSSKALASAVTGLPRRGAVMRVPRTAQTLAVGRFSCAPGRTCRASITVRAGRTVIAGGSSQLGRGRQSLGAPLTRAGRSRLAARRRIAAVLTIKLSEGATKATISVPLVLRGGGS